MCISVNNGGVRASSGEGARIATQLLLRESVRCSPEIFARRMYSVVATFSQFTDTNRTAISC